MSRQKHDAGHIKRARPPSYPSKSKQDRREERAQRVAQNYARVEAMFHQTQKRKPDVTDIFTQRKHDQPLS